MEMDFCKSTENVINEIGVAGKCVHFIGSSIRPAFVDNAAELIYSCWQLRVWRKRDTYTESIAWTMDEPTHAGNKWILPNISRTSNLILFHPIFIEQHITKDIELTYKSVFLSAVYFSTSQVRKFASYITLKRQQKREKYGRQKHWGSGN